MAELLVDRLLAWDQPIPEKAAAGIIEALSKTMDDAALATAVDEFGRRRVWSSAEQLLSQLLGKLSEHMRASILEVLFKGDAIGWLTKIIRGEMFAHGHYGERTQAQKEWLLNEKEFNGALDVILKRYEETPANVILDVPELMSLLYCWDQGGKPIEARKWVDNQIQTDRGLLDFLPRVRGVLITSGGVYYPLNQRDLSHFLDYDNVVERVKRISNDPQMSIADRELANELLNAFNADVG